MIVILFLAVFEGAQMQSCHSTIGDYQDTVSALEAWQVPPFSLGASCAIP